MPRGSGDHQARSGSGVSTIIGKTPCRYAAITVAGSRSPPIAMMSSGDVRHPGAKVHRLRSSGSGRVRQSVTLLFVLFVPIRRARRRGALRELAVQHAERLARDVPLRIVAASEVPLLD